MLSLTISKNLFYSYLNRELNQSVFRYYFNGQIATEDLFINSSTFNLFEERTKIVTGIAGPDRKVWLGKIFV